MGSYLEVIIYESREESGVLIQKVELLQWSVLPRRKTPLFTWQGKQSFLLTFGPSTFTRNLFSHLTSGSESNTQWIDPCRTSYCFSLQVISIFDCVLLLWFVSCAYKMTFLNHSTLHSNPLALRFGRNRHKSATKKTTQIKNKKERKFAICSEWKRLAKKQRRKKGCGNSNPAQTKNSSLWHQVYCVRVRFWFLQKCCSLDVYVSS